MLHKNQIIQATIDALTHEGSGVARHEGMAVFVPGTAPGDRLEIKIVKVLKRYAFGIVHRMITPSPRRTNPGCPVFGRCGGCSLRHLDYSHELAVKADWVTENLIRIGGVRPLMDSPIPSPLHDRYRNKAQYPVREVAGKIRTGFFSPRSHRLIPVEDCLLQPELFARICAVVTVFMEAHGVCAYDEEQHTGLVRHLFLRRGEMTGQVMACLVINGQELPHWEALLESLRAVCPGLTTLTLIHNRERTNVILRGALTVLWGPGYIEDMLCDVRVRLSPLSFYQVNRGGAELLYRAALEYADPEPGDLLLDLYCGAGAIGLSMAHRVRQVIGVEVMPQAVEDAERTAKANGIENARFLSADAAGAARTLEQEGLTPDIVVLDPPRKGAEAPLLETIARMGPKKVVYISCNSATLARDCAILETLGYKTVRARAADLFPRTVHVECVCLLERSGKPENQA